MKFLAPITLALLVFAAACRKDPPLPIYWQVPQFQLTAQDGKPFNSESLAGNVWVADFIYTNCPGPCPRMSAQMRGVQASIQSMPDVKLVSFTVDPEHDTPEALAGYAVYYHAIPGRWFFLTGSESTLQDVCRNGFKLGDVGGALIHSTRFALVDRRGRVRAFYSATNDSAIPHLLHDIRGLRQEKS
jgi:protein SCO1